MTEAAFAPELLQSLRRHDGALGLHAECENDFDFVVRLYTDTRWQELDPIPWPDQAKRDFLAGQCRLQRDHYAQHYVGAELLILDRDAGDQPAKLARNDSTSNPIGRIYLRATQTEVRLMDVALLGNECGRGIGSALIRALQAGAAHRRLELTLHVEPQNPAQRLYKRLGFRLIENRGVYDFLGWTPPSSCDASPSQLNTASN